MGNVVSTGWAMVKDAASYVKDSAIGVYESTVSLTKEAVIAVAAVAAAAVVVSAIVIDAVSYVFTSELPITSAVVRTGAYIYQEYFSKNWKRVSQEKVVHLIETKSEFRVQYIGLAKKLEEAGGDPKKLAELSGEVLVKYGITKTEIYSDGSKNTTNDNYESKVDIQKVLSEDDREIFEIIKARQRTKQRLNLDSVKESISDKDIFRRIELFKE